MPLATRWLALVGSVPRERLRARGAVFVQQPLHDSALHVDDHHAQPAVANRRERKLSLRVAAAERVGRRLGGRDSDLADAPAALVPTTRSACPSRGRRHRRRRRRHARRRGRRRRGACHH